MDNIFLSLQACMLEILRQKEGNLYKTPHLGKAKLQRAKRLPVSLLCSRDLYEAAIVLLRATSRGSELLFDSSSI
ncbi:hypothetical protein F443_01936 [Phytophthora nicotianae P1569]|uniref:Uncharacterized protein n=2 Tax=Phytophthora nicotianae TaxID=4792 RepID=V9FYC0_PHYNI|nr:hypothetical protein F443_01936 [Phytophthora nicotianae P1569]ETO84121.1 hypothetical protein F444_01937 [Phytophthora nicotianae P1976]